MPMVKRPRLKKSNTPTQSEYRNTSKGIRIGKDIGRVKVFVRVRSFNQQEKLSNEILPYEIHDDSTQLRVFTDDRGHPEKVYYMDHIFTPAASNKQVCDVMTPPLVQSAMNGFNGTLMAYGQTGSGKTYSLMSDTGITKSLIDRCFSKIQDDSQHNYKVTVSYLQIYQEKIFDLLTNDQNKGDLNIRENPKSGVYVENLTEYVVRSPTEVLEFVGAGKKRLVFAETKMNRTSSRSHAVLQMTIEKSLKESSEISNSQNGSNGLQKSKSLSSLDLHSFGKDVIVRGKIYICDLAGSERIKRTGASGERLSEAQSINSSLLELGNVIQALADEKATHVPFRNSILTRLLQESLGGNCKTSLIVCVSPSPKDLHESKCTLNFGSRAMKVKNAAYVNMEVDFKSLSDQLLKQMQVKDEEIASLKQSFKQQIENERGEVRAQISKEHSDHLLAIQLEKQALQDKIIVCDAEMQVLNKTVNTRNERIKQLEDSIFSIDDLLKQEKSTCHTLLNAEKMLHKITESRNIEAMNTCIDIIGKILAIDFHDEELLHTLFATLHEELEALSSNNITNFNSDEKLVSKVSSKFEILLKKVSKDINSYGSDNSYSEQELSCLRYKLFLANSLSQLKQALNIFAAHEQIKNLEEENGAFEKRISKKENVRHRQVQCNSLPVTCHKHVQSESIRSVETKDVKVGNNQSSEQSNRETQTDADSWWTTDQSNSVVAGEKLSNNIGMQVDENSFESNNLKTGKTLVSTTVEDVERVVTDIQTENVVENPHLRSSRDIFLGFGNTLDRIEGMVKSDRYTNRSPCSIASRFGLSSYFREDDLIRRQSSLDYRYDDVYNSKYNSRLYDNSRVSSPTADYRANPPYASGEGDGNLKSLYYKLSNKYREIERVCERLKKENQEHVETIERLTRLLPNDIEVARIKENIKCKSEKTSIAIQTDELSDQNMKKQKIKVAHIKPRVSEDIIVQPAINISYDLNENNVVRNIENLQAKSNDKSSLDYDQFELKNLSESKEKFARSKHFKETDLLEFSPEVEKGFFMSDAISIHSSEGIQSDTLNNYSCNVFKVLREKKDNQQRRQSFTSSHQDDATNESLSPRHTRSPRGRPQTWFGFPEDQKKLGYDFSDKPYALDITPHHNMESDVRFSNTRRSSWVLPDWMKTKKKESTNNYQQFIQ